MDPPVTGASFNGAAVIFTPAGEMRLVEHDQMAKDGTGNPMSSIRHGYIDIANRPYVNLPPGSAVVGIARNSAGAPLLLAPPFAIHFNEYGNLIAGQGSDRSVYYDSDYDGKIAVTTSSRKDNYNADGWDPLLTSVTKGSSGRYLPSL